MLFAKFLKTADSYGYHGNEVVGWLFLLFSITSKNHMGICKIMNNCLQYFFQNVHSNATGAMQCEDLLKMILILQCNCYSELFLRIIFRTYILMRISVL